LLDDGLRNLSGEGEKLGARYSVGENDLKEDCRFSVPIVAERWRHGNDLWLQGASRLSDGRKNCGCCANAFARYTKPLSRISRKSARAAALFTHLVVLQYLLPLSLRFQQQFHHFAHGTFAAGLG